jgi:hypothetical protein
MSTLPPGQQLAAPKKWQIVGERLPHGADGPWTISVCGEVARPKTWSFDELATLPAVRRAIDIHCVTRWSKLGMEFEGVLLADLLELSEPAQSARFISFVAHSARDHSSSLPLADALSLETLLALRCDGRPLDIEHGGPVRAVVPSRYFYKSVKWLRRIELVAEDRLGYWESQAGYHNHADPWREQRYIAPGLTRHDVQSLLATRDFSGRDLLGIDAGGCELAGLNAARALLRSANFDRCDLSRADFSSANLSNATLRGANLSGANFSRADVEGADFTAADLRGADFRGASLTAATFCDADAATAPAGAIIDATTQFDRAALEDLMPPQLEYVLRQITATTSTAPPEAPESRQ